ncbi:ABC transporter ATP-binding protein [Anoxynatronum buryatiense]|uniref:Iron complex transport system ATP-binding protein n=1 Tax=Anoxynatronum buryatiense TaxID=489973 RepID=A0AA45WWV5_9CLOT|nr:ABC transporter ATP-binding protein [Anoxynatronum buryatiense]SMP60052.1 iron complex transport system ATP-binding protein [Anoxynatronum buryatiense]
MILNVHQATFSYHKTPVFQHLNLTMDTQGIFCLFGPNGCGKSTLLECLLGYLTLDAGDIHWGQKSLKKMKPQEVARHTAYTPQNHVKSFPYTVLQVVLMGRAAYQGLFQSPSQEDEAMAWEALKAVNMTHYAHTPYTQLSGGESQLVMIARALVQDTPVIIMDEPTAHLDFRHELIVLETIVKLVKEQGRSIIMSTHFPNHAFYFENAGVPIQVALMEKGDFTAQGSPREVLNETNMRDTFGVRAHMVHYGEDTDNTYTQLIPLSLLPRPSTDGGDQGERMIT